jgi:hypothetical protein
VTQHAHIVRVGLKQRKGALAQTHGGLKGVRANEIARVGKHELGAKFQIFGAGTLLGKGDKVFGKIHAGDLEAAPGHLQRVPARPAADIQNPMARLQPAHVEHEIHLGDRVPRKALGQILLGRHAAEKTLPVLASVAAAHLVISR